MRSSRLLSILIILQLRGRVTAEALAAEFEVSVRTIYRDIDALSAAGVPVYGDKGHGGGFSLLDGYRTALTGLDRGEAEALPLIGLPHGSAEAMGLGRAAATARNKLLAALTGGGLEVAGRMADRFHVDMDDWYRSAEPAPYLPVLARAVLDCRTVALTYRSWTGVRAHVLQPLGIVLKGGDWYLCALGHQPEPAIFKVAAVTAATVAADGFERPQGFDLAAWWGAAVARFERELRSEVAHLRLSPLGCQRLAEQGSVAAAAVAAADAADGRGWRDVHLPIEEPGRAALALLALGAEIEVIAPAPLRAEVARQAAAICQNTGTGW